MIPEDLPQIRFPGFSELETIETLEQMGNLHFYTIGADERSIRKWKYYLGVAIFLRIKMMNNKHCQ